MKTEQQIRDYLAEQKRWYKVMDGADAEFRLVEGIIEGLEFVLDRTNEQPENKLPDGLQKYIDGVALNILYQNYHKSTNGIWSRAEIDEEMDAEWMGQDEYYVVNIDFGCQDDTRNEQYRESIDVYRDKETGEWKSEMSVMMYPTQIKEIPSEEDPADRDDRLYHEEQDHIAMGIAKENK